MKRLICIILSLMLTASALVSCTVGDVEYIKETAKEQIGGQTDTTEEKKTEENTENLSTYEKIVAVAEPLCEHYTLERLDQREIFSDFSVENLKEIMAGFDVIIEKNSVIKMKRTKFLTDLFHAKNVQFTYSDEHVFADTQMDKRVLKYAMYASVFMENFPDNVNPTFRSANEDKRDVAISSSVVYLVYGYSFDLTVWFEPENQEDREKVYKIVDGKMAEVYIMGDIFGLSSSEILMTRAYRELTTSSIQVHNMLDFLRREGEKR